MRSFSAFWTAIALVVAFDAAAAATNVTDRLDALESEIATLKRQRVELLESNDRVWLLTSAFTILQMQAGFAMLEAGSTAATSTASILMKNMADLAIGTIGFCLTGWALAFGPSGDTSIPSTPVVGTADFGLVGEDINYAMWVFQLSFAATSATIVSGATAGRIRFKGYLVISCIITALIYPIPAHVAWDSRGFGYQLGFVDFAGSGVVHAAGGLMGLIATLKLGPRQGVFSSSGAYFPVRSSPTTAVLGIFILLYSWFSFNAGSTTSVSNNADLVAALAATNTAMASGCGSVAGMLFSWIRSSGKYIDVYETANGALCGLVGITAGCASVQPWEAAIIGGLCAIAGNLILSLLIRLRIDDPVGVVPVHLLCGMMGVLFVGLFANDPALTPELPVPQGRAGLFHGGGFELLGVQALVMLFIMAWAGVTFTAVVFLLDATMGLRVTAEEEKMLDALEHNLLMVKVHEEFGGSEYSGSWSDLSRIDIAERDKEDVHIPVRAEGEIMTLAGTLDNQPKAVTLVQAFDAKDASPPAGVGGGPDPAVGGDVPPAASLSSAAGGVPGSTASTSRSRNRRMSTGASGRGRRSSVAGKSRRGGGRRRSVTYHTEEVTYMTAEELNAAKEGKMDDTDTMDDTIPEAVTGYLARLAGRSQDPKPPQRLGAPPKPAAPTASPVPLAGVLKHSPAPDTQAAAVSTGVVAAVTVGGSAAPHDGEGAFGVVSGGSTALPPARGSKTAIVPLGATIGGNTTLHNGGSVIPPGAAAADAGAATSPAAPDEERARRKHRSKPRGTASQPMAWQAPRGPPGSAAPGVHAAAHRGEHLEFRQPHDNGPCQQQ